jgi:hypothetical protein
MADTAQHNPQQTSLAIVQEIERIAYKIGSPAITELELALLCHHMPACLSEYRELRQNPAPAKTAPQPAPPRPDAPARLHVVPPTDAPSTEAQS